MIDFYRAWVPYIYLYVVGGGIFIIGMYIILTSNSLNKDRMRHGDWLHVLIFGLFHYMGIHALFTCAALGYMTVTLIIGLVMSVMTVHLIKTIFFKSDRVV